MTDDMESRLTDAMDAQTRNVAPADEQAALAAIAGRVGARRRRGVVVLGVAAALFVLVGSVLLLRRDDGNSDQVRVTSHPSSQSSTASSTASESTTTTTTATTTASSSESTTTTTSAPPPPPTPPPAHVWPLDDTATFATPEDAATSFVHDYLGMVVDVRGATASDESHASVEFFANANGAGRMLVDVVRHDNSWFVIGARADEIVVDTPQPGAPITDPLTVSGRSVAFEAQLGLELRPLRSTSVVSTAQAMGGSTEMQPFSTTIPAPHNAAVLVVFEGDARGEQTFAKATVVLLGVSQ